MEEQRNSVLTRMDHPGLSPSPDEKLLVSIDAQTKLYTIVRTINSEWTTLGYPTIVCVEQGQTRVILDHLVHGALQLVQAHFKQLSTRDDLECKAYSLEGDLTQVQKMYRRCQDDLKEAHRTIMLGKERERRSEEEKMTISNRLKVTMDELRKLQLNFQRYETQSLHERRKLERELMGLRERLSAIINKPAMGNSPIHRSVSRNRNAQSNSILSLHSMPTDNVDLINQRGSSKTQRSTHARVAAKFSQTLSSSHSRDPNERNSQQQDVQEMSVPSQESTATTDLYTNVIRKLEERQHGLLYENRELRDLVGQISSRLVRFTSYLERLLRHSPPQVVASLSDHINVSDDGEFDSLDEDEEEPVVGIARPDSSDEESCRDVKQCVQRRKSANVNQMLLQLPYPLVRDYLIQRVRRLSRDLWRRLKQLTGTNFAAQSNPTHTASASSKTLASSNEPDCAHIQTIRTNDEQSEDQLRNEVIALKQLVENYEVRLQDQELALRHALFTNMRRMSSCPMTSLSPLATAPDHSSSIPNQSAEISPSRHMSPFKVNPMSRVYWSRKTAQNPHETQLPINGQGDGTFGSNADVCSSDINETCSGSSVHDPMQYSLKQSDSSYIPEQQLRRASSLSDSDACSDLPFLA